MLKKSESLQMLEIAQTHERLKAVSNLVRVATFFYR
jgi:hypothetical protein